MQTVGDLGEFGLIERIAKTIPSSTTVVEGIGDDCAVVRVSERLLLVSTDMMVEDVHFRFSTAEPFDVGWKAAAAGLSDVASMGGAPCRTKCIEMFLSRSVGSVALKSTVEAP